MKSKKSKSGAREEIQKQPASMRRQEQGKNSPQRVQHRRDVEDPKRGKKSDNDGGGGDGGRAEMSTSGTGASSNLESQVLTAQKLTQRLGKSSVEETFNKDDVLDVLRGLGELQESVELLQQSGCGKAVANVRKNFFGSRVRHHDKDVATAASALRSRWVATLGKGAPAPASAPTPASTSASASGASSADGKRENADKNARSHHDDPKLEGSSAGARPGRATIVGVGRYARHREIGGQAMKMKKTVWSKVEVKSEVATAAPSVTDDAPPGGAVKEEVPQQAALDEPRCRAMGMLTSVLGSGALATKRCAAIEEELFVSQGEKVGKDYLRRLRSAVFSMEGVEAHRLRDKVMSEMVVPRDFILESFNELRALASMI